MLNPSSTKGKTYADRPITPLGEETGITSTPVSEHPTRRNTPHPNLAPNPYHYQPAITSTRPELARLRRSSCNYAEAQAESLSKLKSAATEDPYAVASEESSPPPRGPQRSYSFSAEDLKRSTYQHLMKDEEKQEEADEEDEDQKKHKALKSPGIGNSELKGREYGFTSAE